MGDYILTTNVITIYDLLSILLFINKVKPLTMDCGCKVMIDWLSMIIIIYSKSPKYEIRPLWLCRNCIQHQGSTGVV